MVKDLSEHKKLEAEKLRAEQSQLILSDAARIFSESIDLDTTLQHILHVVISKPGTAVLSALSVTKTVPT